MFLGSRYSVRGSRYSVRRFNKIKHVEQNLRTESQANVPRVSVRRFCSTGTKSQPKYRSRTWVVSYIHMIFRKQYDTMSPDSNNARY